MQQHKRNAPSEGAVPTAKKSRQLAAEAPPPTTLDEALQIIEMFKAEQAELVDHIVKTDAKSLNAPPAIRALLEQGERGISRLVNAIQKNMQKAYNPIRDRVENDPNFKRGYSVTSDEFSDAMYPFVFEIRKLLDKKSDDELAKLKMAYDLCFKLKDLSIYDPDMVSLIDLEERFSDAPADELLRDIIQRRNDAGDSWDREKDLKELEREAKLYQDYGIEPWFPKSIEALAALHAGGA